MYNPEVKERFISEYSRNSNQAYIRARLTFLGEQERLLSKDISEMSVNEVVAAINNLEFLEMSTAEGFMSIIRSYVEWCRDNGVFENYCGDFLKISVNDIDPTACMSRTFFRDENDFVYSLRKVRQFDELYTDVIVLVFGWLGLSMEEALNVQDDDVDLENRKIYDKSGNERVGWISEEISDILRQYVRTKSAIRQNGTTTYEVVKDLSYNNFVKRVCSSKSEKLGSKLPPRQMVSAIHKLNKQYVELGFNPRFSMQNVQRSGGLYRLWVMEQNGVDIENKSNSGVVQRAYGSKQYRNIVWQYKHYKRAFNL